MTHILQLIKVIKPGLLIRDEAGEILDARSSVTLIRSEANNILVDTSLKKDKKIILQGLKEQGLTPDDISIIINTHWHNDHVGNNKIFTSARVFVHHLNNSRIKNTRIQTFPFLLEPNIEIIETPGHSWDSITVIAKMDATYAITGDAIPIKGNYLEWIPPRVHVDANRALESMEKIVQIADIIIPGHDSPFEIKKVK